MFRFFLTHYNYAYTYLNNSLLFTLQDNEDFFFKNQSREPGRIFYYEA